MPDESGTIVIRPQDFIHGPYVKCPKCHAADAFGVLMIGPHSYRRRCKGCLFSEGFALPKLEKKLIYLDQLAVSDMMKAINPNSRSNRERRVDPFWRELFEALDRLRRLQLIACPESEFHDQESAVSPFRDPLQSLYRHLAAGLRFRDHTWVHTLQIHEQALTWATGNDPKAVSLDRKRVLHGDPSAWTDVFLISANVGDPDGYIDELRRSRAEVHTVLTAIFERWRAKGSGFDVYFLEESRGWALATPSEYGKHLERFRKMHEGETEPTLDVLFPPSCVDVIRAIKDALLRAGVAEDDVWPKLFEYLASNAIDWLPFNRLSASLWATLATQAKDRGRPPNRGLASDIRMISTLLPYCDAIFLDRECHGLLKNIPSSHKPSHSCQVFSSANREEFLEYLRGIENTASTEHGGALGQGQRGIRGQGTEDVCAVQERQVVGGLQVPSQAGPVWRGRGTADSHQPPGQGDSNPGADVKSARGSIKCMLRWAIGAS